MLKIDFLEKVALRRQQDQEELGLVQNEVSQREEAQLVTARKRAHEDLQPYPNGTESMPLNNGRGNYTFLDPKLIMKYLTLFSQNWMERDYGFFVPRNRILIFLCVGDHTQAVA